MQRMWEDNASTFASDWAWITGEPFIFTAWGNGEPNDANCGGEEDGCEQCLEGDIEWNDESCDSNRDCVIEYEPEIQKIVSPIPTLSEWGLIAMAGVLGLVGFMVIRRRKVSA